MLSEETLKTKVVTNKDFKDVAISEMFDFKYKEDVEKCYSYLKIKSLTKKKKVIAVNNKDGMIDLSPCIGIYQEVSYFNDYDIDRAIELSLSIHPKKKYLCDEDYKHKSVERKILIYTAIETNQDRYVTQVRIPFITELEKKEIFKRLGTKFCRDETVQKECKISFLNENGRRLFYAKGQADVIKRKTVYELKFVTELQHEHYLQCACYMIALKLEKGILWNLRDDSCYQIKIPDKKLFMDAVARAITKQHLTKYN